MEEDVIVDVYVNLDSDGQIESITLSGDQNIDTRMVSFFIHQVFFNKYIT
jgi:hypothetical protein